MIRQLAKEGTQPMSLVKLILYLEQMNATKMLVNLPIHDRGTLQYNILEKFFQKNWPYASDPKR